MGFRFSRRWCLTGGGPRGRCPPSWAGTRFFFWGSAPRVYARPPMRGGAAPLQEQVVRLGSSLLPMGRALRPSTPGDFPIAEKVTKGAPRASPFGIPRCGVTALFALAALRSARAGLPSATDPDRFATLRWVSESVFFSPSVSARAHLLVSGRGAAGGQTNGSCCFCAG